MVVVLAMVLLDAPPTISQFRGPPPSALFHPGEIELMGAVTGGEVGG